MITCRKKRMDGQGHPLTFPMVGLPSGGPRPRPDDPQVVQSRRWDEVYRCVPALVQDREEVYGHDHHPLLFQMREGCR